jgi:superfamily I DNA/RNA helicase
LNVTYRCPREIIAPAARLIEHNAERVAKSIESGNRTPGRTRVVALPSREEEVRSVVSAIISSGVPGSWGVLSRTNLLLDGIESRLTAEGVAVSRKGGGGFWEGPIAGFVLSVFGSLTDRNMLGVDMMLKKAGVGEGLLEKIHGVVGSAQTGSLDRFLALPSFGGTVGEAQKRLSVWSNMLASPGVRAYETDDLVVRGVSEYLEENVKVMDTRRSPEKRIADANMMKTALRQFLSRNGSQSKRLSERVRTLQFSQDKEEDDADKVKLMTLHASKGLEFPFVWIIGCEEGVLPSNKSTHFDEERRLFYVGLTRAIREVTVSHVTQPDREIRAGGRKSSIPPSRFIGEAGLSG